MVSPCLKDFVRGVHEAVVYDECSSTTIVNNKTLFQGNSDGVLLGQSQSNEHGYWQFLYCIPQIVCCNDWLDGITPGGQEEEWSLAKSIVYDVQEQLWES